MEEGGETDVGGRREVRQMWMGSEVRQMWVGGGRLDRCGLEEGGETDVADEDVGGRGSETDVDGWRGETDVGGRGSETDVDGWRGETDVGGRVW